MEPIAGVEPAAYGLRNRRSPKTELYRHEAEGDMPDHRAADALGPYASGSVDGIEPSLPRAVNRSRTGSLLVTNEMLYQLSFDGKAAKVGLEPTGRSFGGIAAFHRLGPGTPIQGRTEIFGSVDRRSDPLSYEGKKKADLPRAGQYAFRPRTLGSGTTPSPRRNHAGGKTVR